MFEPKSSAAVAPPPPVQKDSRAKAKPKRRRPQEIKAKPPPGRAQAALVLRTTDIAVTKPAAGGGTPRARRCGPGTGAGGIGTGTGSGGRAGPGGGGDGLAAVRTRLATPPLRGRDFPRELLDAWPRGAWALMRFRIDADGNIIQCITDRGTGNRSIDAQICEVVRRRLRFRPALDRNGRRVADWAAYGQRPL